jgi:hypothetical protein
VNLKLQLPGTFNWHTLEPLTKGMREKKVGTVIITNSDGVLIGLLYRKVAEERVSQEKPSGERVG